jgi:ankyrin repeat protein
MLGRYGHTSWWDPNIAPGDSFVDKIHEELESADFVVVVWTISSVTSRWVRDEAEEGLRRGVLVPVLLDKVRAPLGLRSIQTVDLSNWDGGTDNPAIVEILRRLAAGHTAPTKGAVAVTSAQPWLRSALVRLKRLKRIPLAIAVSLAVTFVLVVTFFYELEPVPIEGQNSEQAKRAANVSDVDRSATGQPAADTRQLDAPVKDVQVEFTTDRFPYAAAAGTIDQLKNLLVRGASVETTTAEGDTALHMAARAGKLDVVEFLVARKASLNSKNSDYETPLYLAAREGYATIVNFLILKGANPNLAAHTGTALFASSYQSALAAAAGGGHKDVVAVLLASGVSVNAESRKEGMMNSTNFASPLSNALNNGHLAIAQYLIEHGARSTSEDLLRAVSAGVPAAVVRSMLKSGSGWDAKDFNGRNALEIAKAENRPDLVEVLGAAGAR